MNYKIILNQDVFESFLCSLPGLQEDDVWYAALFGRHKYDAAFPNTKDSGQLARFIAGDRAELWDKIRRLECPVGSFTREYHGERVPASQECLALYLAMNPRSLPKANKGLLVELARRVADGDTNFNPISVATTAVHHAVGRKFYLDFDFDDVDLSLSGLHLRTIQEVFPDRGMYRILKTRGGCHVLVDLAKIGGLKTDWYRSLSQLPQCDVHGTNVLTPVPGCTQGGFSPYFL